MAWLEAGAGLMVAALVLVRCLGSHMRLVWRYGPTHRAAVTATVVRPARQRVVASAGYLAQIIQVSRLSEFAVLFTPTTFQVSVFTG
jgi:hypothetical protein